MSADQPYIPEQIGELPPGSIVISKHGPDWRFRLKKESLPVKATDNPDNPIIAAMASAQVNREAMCLAMRVQGCSQQEIADKSGLSRMQVRYALRRFRYANRLNEVSDMLDKVAVPQAVENLVDALENPANPHWWEATKEVLHGRGALVKAGRGGGPGGGVGDRALPPLQIAIINPGGGELSTVIVNSERGSVVGSGRSDEVLDAVAE